MGISKKINTALVILKQNGAAGVYDTIRQKIAALTCTNENEIIFEILQDSTLTGVMCDVGAHHGYCLLPFAKAGWQIFAFEPDPDNHSQLVQNTSVYSNVHLDGRAVSDKLEASVPFFTSKESNGVSSLSPFLPSHELAYRVNTTTLGDFFREQDVVQDVVSVDYLKIDTAGFDLMILQGLSWDQIHPRVIICEFEDLKTQKIEYNL